MSTEIHQGDAVEVMAGMAAEPVDAIVTDPPHMIGVLGNEWDRMASRDFQAWCQAWAAEALRVLKPGGYLASFRYTPKAPSSERPTVDGVTHPTPKPLALIRWLVDLITPLEGVVLDPFAGSGTTALAALAEGRRPVLIEKEPEYVRIIRHRLADPAQLTFAVS